MPGSKPEDIQTTRIPFVAESLARGTLYSKDQRFVNCFFDVLKNSATSKTTYFLQKRPGMSQFSQPTGAAGTGRGFISWRGDVYSCYGTQLYKNNTNLGVTLPTSSGDVFFEYTRPSSTTPQLGVTDGTILVVISTGGLVTVHNNKNISTSSVANPTVITTATAHGLATGNKVVIRGHTGSTPNINNTEYFVTVTSPTSFTIPVNVTVAGSGGTIGVFPSPNLGRLVYFDGYVFLLAQSGAIYNCELDDLNTWEATKFIVPIMDNGTPVGIARQSNFIVYYSNTGSQAFYNAANALGSPLSNYEQAQIQIGCSAPASITSFESFITWIGAGDTGGFTVYKLAALGNPKEIGDPTINRVLNAEKDSIVLARAHLVRISGHIFYILNLAASQRTFLYDFDTDIWTEWTGTDGVSVVPIQEYRQHNQKLLGQHLTNGKIYTISPEYGQDDGVNFPVSAQFGRVDFDTNSRKFVTRVELIGDSQDTTTPVSLQYSDDDFRTLSAARTLDMGLIGSYATGMGSFKRRGFKISYSGANPLRLEALQIKFRLAAN